MEKNNVREAWVDNTKVVACILVVLGHFFQSMTKAAILPESDIYKWFIQTIYYFHVPLFFICSGYLYQVYSSVNSLNTWKNNVVKKAVSLGVPYFIFSLVTWILKTVFSDSVNDKTGGLVETLFLKPLSPYWYLYCLFLIFVITPTFVSMKYAFTGLVLAVVLKAVSLAGGGTKIYALSIVMQNELWFVIGMCIGVVRFAKYIKRMQGYMISAVLAAGFIIASVFVYKENVHFYGISVIMCSAACVSVIIYMISRYAYGKNNVFMLIAAKYTMPVFVMHTLFAAPVRSFLLKAGISNAGIHIVAGLAASFCGPVVAAEIMKRTGWLEFFLYPWKILKIRKPYR